MNFHFLNPSRMNTRFFRFISALAFTVLSYLPASAQMEAQSTKAIIVAANQKFVDAFAQGATAMGQLYTRDAVMYNAHSEPVRGTAALDGFWKSVYGAGVKRMTLETVEAEPAGPFLLETGRFASFDAAGTLLDEGNYLVVWKKEDNIWKLHRDIGNSNRPVK